MPSPDDIRAAIDRYTQLMSANDKDGWVATFADGARVEDPVGSEERVGREAIAAFWDEVHGLSPAIRLELTGPVRVAGAEAAFPMRAITELGDSSLVVDIIDVMSFDDECRITELRAFWDPNEMHPYEG